MSPYSALEIKSKNKRHQAGGYYLKPEELQETLAEAYPQAINRASLEVAEGIYDADTLETLINREEIIERAFALIAP